MQIPSRDVFVKREVSIAKSSGFIMLFHGVQMHTKDIAGAAITSGDCLWKWQF